jgi:accessory gene regulator B
VKNKIVNYNVNKLKKKNKYTESQIRIYKYGLEASYSMITKLTVVFILSYFLNTFYETLFLTIFYTLVRSFAFGIHASSNLHCWIITLLVYTLVPLIIKSMYITNIYYYLIFVVCSIIIGIYAPADTPKRPLIHEKKRRRCKLITIIIISMLFILSFIINNFVILYSILWSLIIEAICINPLIYKITNTQYNNYRYYKIKSV